MRTTNRFGDQDQLSIWFASSLRRRTKRAQFRALEKRRRGDNISGPSTGGSSPEVCPLGRGNSALLSPSGPGGEYCPIADWRRERNRDRTFSDLRSLRAHASM